MLLSSCQFVTKYDLSEYFQRQYIPPSFVFVSDCWQQDQPKHCECENIHMFSQVWLSFRLTDHKGGLTKFLNHPVVPLWHSACQTCQKLLLLLLSLSLERLLPQRLCQVNYAENAAWRRQHLSTKNLSPYKSVLKFQYHLLASLLLTQAELVILLLSAIFQPLLLGTNF